MTTRKTTGKAKRIEYRVSVTAFAANYNDNVESYAVVKARSAREAAEEHLESMRRSGLSTDVRPVGGFSRTWADVHGDGHEACTGRNGDAADLTHRLYVRPEAMY
jgi:hypothetical protein